MVYGFSPVILGDIGKVYGIFLVILVIFGKVYDGIGKYIGFLRASAMLKHVIDIVWTSVRPSVCPSVTRWHPIKTAEHIVMLSTPHDSPFILVFCV